MNILTFQIADWFHTHKNRKYVSGYIWNELPSRLEDKTVKLLEFLESVDVKATFFILGWVAENNPSVVKQIFNAGHEIAAYSNWCHNAQKLVPEDFERDLIMCLSRISNVTGEKVTIYRAPGFSLKSNDDWAFEILNNYGILIDSSVQLYKSNNRGPFERETSNGSILEFPLLKTMFGFPYSGGGYFRVLPPKVILEYMRNSNYNLLYLHPRDLDPDNPNSNLFSAFRNWFNRYNAEGTLPKLSAILRQHKTMTIGEAANEYLRKK